MSAGDNNIHSQFQSAFGRDATPYELKTYNVAKPLDIANIKDFYSKLNKDTSVVDYAKYNGIDPATLPDLAKQYGYQYGTAEGNTSLLNALKSGQQPGTQNTPVGGSIIPPKDNQQPPATGVDAALQQYNTLSSQIAAIDKSINDAIKQKTDELTRAGQAVDTAKIQAQVQSENASLFEQRTQLADQQSKAGKMYSDLLNSQNQNQQTTDGQGGSVSTAAKTLGDNTGGSQNNGSSNQTPAGTTEDTDPQVVAAKKAVDDKNAIYTTAQANVADIDNQIRDLRNIMRNALHDKEKEAQAAGEPMDRAQIAQQVYAEKSDIQNQISDLLDVRATAASKQAQAGNDLKVAQSNWNAARTDYFKQSTLDLNTQKATAAQDLAIKKFNQANISVQKVSYTDLDGNKQQSLMIVNKDGSMRPVTKADAVSAGMSDSEASAATGGTGGAETQTASTDTNTPIEWKSNNEVLATKDNTNKPGYWYDQANNRQVDTGRTIGYIQQQAILLALDKSYKVQSAVGGLSSGSVADKALKKAIQDKMNAITSAIGVDQSILQPAYSSATAALKTQINAVNQIHSSLATAEMNSKQIQDLFKGKKINENDPTVANKTLNELSKIFTTGEEIKAYQGALKDLAQDYSSVFARTGQRSVASDTAAANILDGNITLAGMKTISDTLNTLGDGAVQARKEQIDKLDTNGVLSSFYDYIYPGVGMGRPEKTTQTVQSNGQTYNVGQVYNDGTANWVVDAQGNWTQQK